MLRSQAYAKAQACVCPRAGPGSAAEEGGGRRARISLRMPSGTVLVNEHEALERSAAPTAGLLPAPRSYLDGRRREVQPQWALRSSTPAVAGPTGRPRRQRRHSPSPEPEPELPSRQRAVRRTYREVYSSASEDFEEAAAPQLPAGRAGGRSSRRRGSQEAAEPPAASPRRPRRAAAAAAARHFFDAADSDGASDPGVASHAHLPPRRRPQRTARLADLAAAVPTRAAPSDPLLQHPLLYRPAPAGVPLLPEDVPAAGAAAPGAAPTGSWAAAVGGGVLPEDASAPAEGWSEEVRRGKRSSRSRSHPVEPQASQSHALRERLQAALHSASLRAAPADQSGIGGGGAAPQPPSADGRWLDSATGEVLPWAGGPASAQNASAGASPPSGPWASPAVDSALLAVPMDTGDTAEQGAAAEPSDCEFQSAASAPASECSGGAAAGPSSGWRHPNGVAAGGAGTALAVDGLPEGELAPIGGGAPSPQTRQPLRIKVKLPPVR